MRKVYCYVLPAIFTAGNLACGFFALALVVQERFAAAAWAILIAMIFDIMDGRVARLTKGVSPFGAEFDSIADVVSFGAAPALLILCAFFKDDEVFVAGSFAAFVYLLCGALRLARFNVSPASDEFSGLPIPGGAAIISTIVLYDSIDISHRVGLRPFFLVLFVTLTAVMMVSTVPYPSMKKNKDGRGSLHTLVKTLFVLVVAGGTFHSPEAFMFVMAISYLVSGPVFSIALAVRHLMDNDSDDIELEVARR